MKRTHIKKRKTRFLLSDVLPYETPIFFSNRSVVKYLDKAKIDICLDGESLSFSYGGGNASLASCVIRALLEMDSFVFDKHGKASVGISSLNRIPYVFEVPRDGKENRKLSVIHPANQLSVMAFFDKYKETILYFCSRSQYSIRFPMKIANWVFYQDKTHYISQINNKERDTIEEFTKEYEALRSFFSYKKYSNIYKFYDSEFYNSLESKFSSLVRIDISHFFDSIYTHSLCWHIYGKEYTKMTAFEIHRIKGCFGDLWDSIMQRMNNNETNGIVIGPEFSRVFAEVIAQKIDCLIEKRLNTGCFFQKNISFGTDYFICRYVDDFFIFTNSEEIREKIVKTIREVLSSYRYYINDAKTEALVQKPLISNISSTKYQIELLLKQIKVNKEDDKPRIPYISATSFIQGMKTILHQNNVLYSDVVNYTLALLERHIEQVISFWNKNNGLDSVKPYDLTFFFLQIEKIVFFLLNTSSGVNVAIRVCRISLLLINCIKQNHRKYNKSEELFLNNLNLYDYVYTEINSYIMRKGFSTETSYLLVLARELGKGWYLPQKVLSNILSNCKNNYFGIVSCLFYTTGKQCYKEIIDLLFEHAKAIVSMNNKKHSERVLMLFDGLVCPYFNQKQKRELLKEFDCSIVTKKLSYKSVINYFEENKIGFTNWGSFNFAKELDMKKGQFVY